MSCATRKWSIAVLLLLIALIAAPAARAQVARSRVHFHVRTWSANVVVPQSRPLAARAKGAVQTTAVDVGVVILQQVATTTMDISLKNNTSSRQTAELLVPVPDGAVVRSFTFQGAASEPTAEVLRKDEARKTFDSIVAKIKDPALLELAGFHLIRTSVFPVDPRGTQKVRLTYEHLLPADGERVDYVLPRSESVSYDVPWNVSVRIKSKRPILTVYSPSHKLETTRTGKNIVSARIASDAVREPGEFRLSYLIEKGDVTASLFAYPDGQRDGGYFLLLAGLAHKTKKLGDGPRIKREITLVLDRSGSMAGEKMEQARSAAEQILAGLEMGETFNIIVYNGNVDVFSKQPVEKTEKTIAVARTFLKDVTARGGTNIHDALLEALRPKPNADVLPIVLFLTDGLPTMGQTSEVAIRNLVTKVNPYERRVFTFGVGLDVNTPLLDKLAVETRAFSSYVLPNEDIELKVARVFRGLDGPVLASPELTSVNQRGGAALGRVTDVTPGRLPDLFKGDQLVVLGQYKGQDPLHFVLSGNHLGKKRKFRLKFKLDGATTRNAFVPRLWASRKIAAMIDKIRDMGAEEDVVRRAKHDPKLKELTDEIVKLSTEFGILTEYTAFLAREGTDLSKRDDVLAEASRNFQNRAMATRDGRASVNQEFNNGFQRFQTQLNRRNGYWNQNLQRVEVTQVQQMNDTAFYRRGNQWVDSRLVENQSQVKPSKVIDFGSKEFLDLAWKLARQGRQSSVSLDGDILLTVDGEPVLVKGVP